MENSTMDNDNFKYNFSDMNEEEDALVNIDPYLVMEIVLCAVVFVFGTLGNSLILRVYWMKRCKTTTHILIMALASADLMVCLTQPFYITEASFALAGKQFYSEKLYIVVNVTNMLAAVSVEITAVIAVDRYDCVCRPQKRWFNPRRVRKVIVTVAVLSMFSEVPDMLRNIFNIEVTEILARIIQIGGFATALLLITVCYSMVYMRIRRHVKVGIWSRQDQGTFGTDRNTKPSPGNSPAIKMNDIVHQPALPVPVTMVTGRTLSGESTNSSAVRPTNKHVGWNNRASTLLSHTSAGKSPNNALLQRKTTRMLFVTSLVFILTWLPSWTSIALGLTVFSESKDKNLSDILNYYIPTTCYINNAVNPLIYSLSNRRFRDECKKELHKMSNLCSV